MRSLLAITLVALFTTVSFAEEAAKPAAVVHVDRNNESLPPAAELAKETGDAAKGAASYAPFCGLCHQINGVGVDFGPNLSDIGTRKTKEQIIQSILEPSAIIEPGFENYIIKLENDNVAVGLISAESDSEVTVKAMGGAKTIYKKADIVSRDKQAFSLMPAGLNRALTKEELVNVVEYLFAQKAASK